MSGSEDQGGAGRREVAYRLFAAEFEDADFSYSESDEERAPNYVVSPTGGRVNRLFVVGVLTEVENASEDVLRARVVDPTGAVVVYAGQYQPEAQAFFDQAQPPMFVAVTGKARTFQPDDSDVTYTSIRPENVNEVDAETRDRWTVGTARQTLDRVRTMADALSREERGDELRAALEAEGVDTGLAAGIPLAIDHYGTTAAYLDAVRSTAVQALEVVAGEREEVDTHTASPDAPGDADLATLAGLDVAATVGGETTDLGSEAEEAATASDDAPTAGGDTATSTTEADTATASDDADGSAADDATTASEPESEPAATQSNGPDTAEPESVTESATSAEAESEPATDPGEPEPTESNESEPAATESATVGSTTGSDTTDAGSVETGAPDAGADSPDAGADAAGGDDLDDFDGEFELDDDEREEIEQEYGTGFTSGNEVDEPGEAGIETPDPEELAEAEAEAGTGDSATPETASEPADTEPDPTESEESDAAADASSEDATTEDTAADEDVDLEDAVMDAMTDHDDGEGAHADEIVDAVTARTGADGEDVRDAIQDALMGGRCYEPEDDVYKPI